MQGTEDAGFQQKSEKQKATESDKDRTMIRGLRIPPADKRTINFLPKKQFKSYRNTKCEHKTEY